MTGTTASPNNRTEYRMTEQMRTRYTARYMYPGAFFAEDVTREIAAPTFAAVVAAGPDEDGYFVKDGWYAAEVTAITEKRFAAADGEEAWVRQGSEKVASWVVGERIHYTAIDPDGERGAGGNRILISNIKGNSRDGGYGVLTRCGNWQIASDFQAVVSAHEASR